MVQRLSQISSSILLLVLLTVISLSHQSCIGGDKDPYELGPYEWGEFWKSHIYFKEGSWWVYQSIDGRDTLYDTVRVVTSDLQMVRYDDAKPRNWKVTKEWFRYTMTSTVQGDVIHESPQVGILDATDTMHYSRFLLLRNVWGDGSISPFFIYRLDYPSSYGGASTTTVEAKRDELEIDGRIFDNVMQFHISRDGSWSWAGNPARYSWAKEVGLVQREDLSTGEKWSLVDYEVIQ